MFTALALTALVGACDAFAATVEVQERGIGGISYKADRGERNRVTIGYRRTLFTISDTGARIAGPRKRCRPLPRKRIRCGSPRTAAANLSVKLFDGNDRLTIKRAHRRGFTAVYAGAGDDLIRAGSGAGSASLLGEEGSDRLTAGRSRSDSEIDGGEGPDTAVGGPGRDLIYDSGYGGPDAHGQDNDRVDGGPGNDSVSGDLGDDVVLGGAGNDVLGGAKSPEEGGRVDQGADRLDGGPGNDVVSGRDEDPSEFGGGPHADRVKCGPGNDRAIVDQLDIVDPDCERIDRTTVEPEEPFAVFRAARGVLMI